MLLPSTKKELELIKSKKIVIGVDEVGRGPLAGPVVAVASWVEPGYFSKKFKLKNCIRDSKTLSEKQRNEVFEFLNKEKGFKFGIGEVSPKTIDRINILNASLLAMRLAVENLQEKLNLESSPFFKGGLRGFSDKSKATLLSQEKRDKGVLNFNTIILVDGNKIIPGINCRQEAIAKGDQSVFSIAGASIYAKVYRDNLMLNYHKKFPQYFFDCHKGYGTKKHIEALKNHGICEIHRKSFGPVKVLVN